MYRPRRKPTTTRKRFQTAATAQRQLIGHVKARHWRLDCGPALARPVVCASGSRTRRCAFSNLGWRGISSAPSNPASFLSWVRAFWSDSYFPPPCLAPSVIVVQPSRPSRTRPSLQTEEPKSAAPLLIEWQGDRYVRRASTAELQHARDSPDYIADANTPALDKPNCLAPQLRAVGLSRNDPAH